jgi:ADP-L-glycero-D-manno-heptose 6-epimerase
LLIELLFDQRMRRELGADFSQALTQVAGFRYFNVYGPREQHKGRMASVAYHQYHQFIKDGQVRLFGAYGGYGQGQQMRDFVFVDDVVAVNLWFFDHPERSGLFNLGSGRAQAFNDVALAVVQSLQRQRGQPCVADLAQAVGDGLIAYIDFPAALVGKYQCHTQADLSALRQAGCEHRFADVASGVSRYMDALAAQA